MPCALKCSCEWCQDDGEDRILDQSSQAVKPGQIVEAISKTNCRNQHFDGIAQHKPGNRTQRHACMQVSKSKSNKGRGDNYWPDTNADQQQPCHQNRATWPE